MTVRTIAAARIAAILERSRYFAEAREHAADLRETAAAIARQTGTPPTHVDTPYGRFSIAELLP